MSSPQQPPEPLDVDGVAAMTVGTGLWVIAFVVLLLTGTAFDGDRGWWLWVCLAGIVIGAIAMVFTSRRRSVYRSAAEAGAGS